MLLILEDRRPAWAFSPAGELDKEAEQQAALKRTMDEYEVMSE